MQDAAADPGRRPATHQPHQFVGVDLRRPKGYAAAAPEPPVREAAPAAAKAAAEGGDPCPRCASRDTKFCYYNNYNTAQPRHFCKGCRRYWTKGGTLRNVPVGGGTRKKPSSSSSSSQPSAYAAAGAAGVDSRSPPPTKKKPAGKKRRVEAPQPQPVAAAVASTATDPVAATDSAKTTTTTTTDPVAATDSAKTTTTTTTDGASEVTTESAAAAVPVAAPAAEEEDSDSLTHLLLQPGAEDAVALGLGLSDFPSAGGKALPLLDDDSFQWPAAYDLGACWASAGFGDADPTGLFLNLP